METTPLQKRNKKSSDKLRRAVLVGLIRPGQPGYVVEEHLDELADLAASNSVNVVARLIQKRRAPDAATFIGRGKADELALAADELGAEIVIFDDDLSPSQVKNLEGRIKAAVIDRSRHLRATGADQGGQDPGGAGAARVPAATSDPALDASLAPGRRYRCARRRG